MNDFLQSIRGNQKDKRSPKTRRSFDNSNFNTSPNFNSQNFQNQGNYQATRSGNIKRSNTRVLPHAHFHGDETQPQPPYSPQLDPSDVMLDLLDAFTKNQEMMISVQEKRILAEERKAIALEEIAEYLRVITMPSFQKKINFKGMTSESKNQLSHNVDGYVSSDKVDQFTKSEHFIKTEQPIDTYDSIKFQKSKLIQESETIGGEIVHDVKESIVDAKDINIENDYTQDAEYSIKSSVKQIEDNDNILKDEHNKFDNSRVENTIEEQPIKVIRRKKVENRKNFISSIEEPKIFVPETSSNNGDMFQSKAVRVEKDALNSIEDIKDNIINSKEIAPTKEEEKDEKMLFSREEIIEIINSMRTKGKTFDEVAQHLIDLGQPTFSGRGVWHAQTIHRICTRDEKKGSKSCYAVI